MKIVKYIVKKNKKVIGKIKIETPTNLTIDEFVCLRGKIYAFKCGDESKNEIEGISKSSSKISKVEEYKKRLDGEEYEKECETYVLRSVYHEMYLQN